ncbi:LacI family transcriptional regulator [Arthrobacter sp. SLBN-112]|uniref:LacI family DNA-binding transcriptional regulator n=1 Tax=Arthrobacter sp. SLBN-112 TaxID=2768452 RepID=UPI001153A702|nr:LacI family DNA-binding transcriptional regulator [Arthrobacter sp. SLBN-112]TQJ41189.1 LacI family transcriptional regulator [Arthrobacter sp. SLBN-112]
MDLAVTLKNVAAHAGVSRTTASNVVTGTGRVSSETRDRVHQAMRELGYVYNRGAASLRTRRTTTVGVVVTDIANPFFGELLVGLEAALAEAGFRSLVVASSDDPVRQDELIAELREYQVAGLAIMPASRSGSTFLEALEASRVPHVFVTKYLEGVSAPYVGPDDKLGGRLAAEHLLGHGCRSFAFVGGFSPHLSRRDRIEGVRSALADAGMDPALLVEVESPTNGEGGLQAGQALLERGVLPEAIICQSDGVAFGVYRALRIAGRASGVRLIGYDDVRTAALWEPPLTSVATRPELLGRAAAELLLEEIAEPAAGVSERVFAPELVVRESCGCQQAS